VAAHLAADIGSHSSRPRSKGSFRSRSTELLTRQRRSTIRRTVRNKMRRKQRGRNQSRHASPLPRGTERVAANAELPECRETAYLLGSLDGELADGADRRYGTTMIADGSRRKSAAATQDLQSQLLRSEETGTRRLTIRLSDAAVGLLCEHLMEPAFAPADC
jgi:hypothetical protein